MLSASRVGTNGEEVKIDNSGVRLLSLKFAQFLHLLHFQKIVDAAEVFLHSSSTKFVDAAHKAVKEVAVVTHTDERSIEILQRLF